jgi:NAD(P)-dependent dehydrogenase (short-subunit alcohol dehydrogenase family)
MNAQSYGIYADSNGRFAPLLEASSTRQDPSRIIIVSSTAGKNVPHVGENGTIMYSVSKAAAHVSLHRLY